MAQRWHIWIDTGGTFTDCLAVDPAGRLHRAKVLSSGALRGRVIDCIEGRRLRVQHAWPVGDDFVRGWTLRWLGASGSPVKVAGFRAATSELELDTAIEAPSAGTPFEIDSGLEAPLLAARLVTGARDLQDVDMRLATTRGTNALLERRGARLALFITKGFGDLLHIGDQQRPDLFALHIEKPDPLPERVVEVTGRLAADGTVVEPIALDEVRSIARDLVADGVRTAAVALLHSYRNPEHERALATALWEAGFDHVSCSSELSPLIKLLPRTETAVADAYLAPVIESYLQRVAAPLGGGGLHVMTSAGGLVRAEAAHARDLLLSGPAGGVAGVAAAARRSGFERALGLDMGGTSTDVCRFDGDFEYQFEHRVGGVRLAAPALAIETVAAGGGSICEWTEIGLRVGPRSASASPGPACYGAGGPLTLTDVNLLLGRLDPEGFEIPISVEAAETALAHVHDAAEAQGRTAPPRDELLEGFLAIANQRMADAIAEVSLRRGYDPGDYALVGFGGAGGQHACAVADHLGVSTIVLPADASLLSALGLGAAAIERFAHRQVLAPLDDVGMQLEEWLDELGEQARTEVCAEGIDRDAVTVRRRIVHLRLEGQDATIEVPMAAGVDELVATFARRYEAMYGHPPHGRPLEVESIRAVASSPAGQLPEPEAPAAVAPAPTTRRARFGGAWLDVPVHERTSLPVGTSIRGPALIVEAHSAAVIEPGWQVDVDAAAALVVSRHTDTPRATQHAAIVRQELFTNRFSSIARRMGRMLERTALSTNVKERLDFSCALLDGEGELVVHAPHMPVHLGALGLCVRAVRDAISLEPGDVVITNHPAFGGSHIPDVTVVTPIFHDATCLGYAASRAHHAEIGGTRPGSMPPRAGNLAEEGVVIPPMHLVRAGVPCFDDVAAHLEGGPWPSRAVSENLADLRAAVAANRFGETALAGLAAEHGTRTVMDQMAGLKDRAEQLARALLARWEDGRYEAEQTLDDGAIIKVAIELTGDAATIDFAGSSGVHPGNLNATPAVVRSAVIYVLRCLIGEALPLNEGLMRAVDVRIPTGMLNPDFPDDPAKAPAVGGGNVETSQRIVDTLLLALNACACSQGTMNNTLFGNDRFSYYETVCGGSGAGPGFDGADAVHTHMTNTRITDPEILEHRYPVRLERFALRADSGGRGAHRGGHGVSRELTFLEPASLTILTQHRREGPYGLEGGGPGRPGAQRVVRSDGTVLELESVDGVELGTGDRLILETPGGGGWGPEGS